MKTPEVEVEFVFSTKKGLKESADKQLRYGGTYDDFAKALINVDEILGEAILLEKHGDKYKGTPRADNTLQNVSVLLGAFQSGNTIIPVQFEIKKSSSYGGRLYLFVTLTKTEADVMEKASSRVTADPSLVSASEYSLSNLLRKVNPMGKHFLKYIPDGFLSEAQRKAKEEALEEDQRRIIALSGNKSADKTS